MSEEHVAHPSEVILNPHLIVGNAKSNKPNKTSHYKNHPQMQLIPNKSANHLLLINSKSYSLPGIATEEDSAQANKGTILTMNTKSELEPKSCRICFELESTKSKLISPCQCSGSGRYIHEDCLITWIKSSEVWAHNEAPQCEYCKFKYQALFFFRDKLSTTLLLKLMKRVITVFAITFVILMILFSAIFLILTSVIKFTEEKYKRFIWILVGIAAGIIVLVSVLYFVVKRKDIYKKHLANWHIIDSENIVKYERLVNSEKNTSIKLMGTEAPSNYPFIFDTRYETMMQKE